MKSTFIIFNIVFINIIVNWYILLVLNEPYIRYYNALPILPILPILPDSLLAHCFFHCTVMVQNKDGGLETGPMDSKMQSVSLACCINLDKVIGI